MKIEDMKAMLSKKADNVSENKESLKEKGKAEDEKHRFVNFEEKLICFMSPGARIFNRVQKSKLVK